MIFHVTHLNSSSTFRKLFKPKVEGSVGKKSRENDSSFTKGDLKSLLRNKVGFNRKKTCSLLKNYRKTVLAKRQRILEIRRKKLEQYRIDYIPLCSEEDMLNFAAANSLNSGFNALS